MSNIRSKLVAAIRDGLEEVRIQDMQPRWILFTLFMLLVWIVAAGFLIARFFWGLRAASAMTDLQPWGLWIAFKLWMVACAAGGFVFAGTVYVFRIRRYRPIARTAVLLGLLGYTFFIISLIFDLGRWYNIWHPIVMWNFESVMFEVAWCVMLYTVVLYAEFSPALFERLGWLRAQRLMHAVVVPLVIAGIVLSTLHQSSLGSLFLVVPEKLHPFWWSLLLPVFFLVSAVAAGFAMLMLVPPINARLFHDDTQMHVTPGLTKPAAVVLLIYLAVKLWDYAVRGVLPLALTLDRNSALLWLELGIGVIAPMVIFFLPQARIRPSLRNWAAVLVILGVGLNRLNVAVLGFVDFHLSLGYMYVPSFGEWMITLALFCAAAAAYALITSLLPVLPTRQTRQRKMAVVEARAERQHPR